MIVLDTSFGKGLGAHKGRKYEHEKNLHSKTTLRYSKKLDYSQNTSIFMYKILIFH